MATFVLIPGGWQGGWVYGQLAGILVGHGHAATPVTLPGLSDVPHPTTNLDDHIGTAVWNMRPIGGHLVLVGHSDGGMVVNGVADATPSRLRALVYVDAYVPDEGDPCWSLTTARFQDMFAAGARSDVRAYAPPPGMDPRCRRNPIGTFLRSTRLTGHRRDVSRKTYFGALGWEGSPFLDLHRRLGATPSSAGTTWPCCSL